METKRETKIGVLERIYFQQDGFIVGRLSDGTVVKGRLFAPHVGTEISLEGECEWHPTYGPAFRFDACKVSLPRELGAIRTYLKESCPFVGPVISRRLVETYGAETLDVCKKFPDRVAGEVQGIGLERARAIAEKLEEIEKDEELTLVLTGLFAGLSVPNRAIEEVRRRWGREAPERIRANPYALAEQIDGIGFPTADRIALRAGFEPDGSARVRAGMVHALKEAASTNGHVCLPEGELIRQAARILDVAPERIAAEVEPLVESGALERGPEGLLYLSGLARDEDLIAQKLAVLLCARVDTGRPVLDGLAPDQAAAVEAVSKTSVFVLTGAPGTGKTTCCKQILASFPEARMALCSPTGRGAKRMSEQTARPATTIHRLLGPVPPGRSVERVSCLDCAHTWEYVQGAAPRAIECEECGCHDLVRKEVLPKGSRFVFMHNHKRPLPYDLVIVDELSLIDTWLMARLVDAIRPGTRLVLVGDSYQLPSVGPGRILGDLIEAGIVPSVELTIIKRQDPGLITTNCHLIKDGRDVQVKNEAPSDFFILARETPEAISDTILEIVSKRLPVAYGVDAMKHIQVISPLREKTDLSCKALNVALQSRLNPGPFPVARCPFKRGDRVVNTRNNHESSIMNGDLGFVQSVDEQSIAVEFQDPVRLVEVPTKKNDLELAYVITCHRFQGSEAPVVVIPVHRSFGSLIMQRPWVYTAVSRAKRACVLVGQPDELSRVIRRGQQVRRYSGLRQRIAAGVGRLAPCVAQ